MRIFHWRPDEDYDDPNWKLMDHSYTSEQLGLRLPRQEVPGYPFYTKPVPQNALVDVNWDTKTHTLSLNWIFSYGIVTQDVRPMMIGVTCDPQFEGIGGDDKWVFTRHATIPRAYYYRMNDKGGVSYLAVQDEIDDI